MPTRVKMVTSTGQSLKRRRRLTRPDLMVKLSVRSSAVARVLSLRVLSDNHPIELARLAVLQGRLCAWNDLGAAMVSRVRCQQSVTYRTLAYMYGWQMANRKPQSEM